MKFYTIGYDGRDPQDLVEILKVHGIIMVVDVRLRPEHSSIGAYAKAKDRSRGIEHLLEKSGIAYSWFPELGNIFLDLEDWREQYKALFEVAGELLTTRLVKLQEPFCLICAEKDPANCHRQVVADYLVGQGHEVKHLK